MQSNNYLPLAVGNEWEFNSYVLKIDNSEVINKKTYYLVIQYFKNPEISARYSYYLREQNNVIYKKYDGLDEFRWLDLNVSEGETYQIQDPAWDLDNDTPITDVSIISKNQTIELQNRIINECYQFYFDIAGYADEENSLYLALDIGFVCFLSNAWGSKEELISAKLSGKTYNF